VKTFHPPAPLFTVRVKVPATSANLGPGFDVLGVTLDHHNEVEVSAWDDPLAPPATLQVDGEGSGRLPLDKENLVFRMALRTAELIGRKLPALRVKLVNRIPLARGMGSSSAAIVGGILAVNAGCGSPLSLEEMIRLAVAEEGHPDNVVPALAGGLCASVVSAGTVRYVSWSDPKLFAKLRAVLCVPYFELATDEARAALPERVPREDAIFNVARVALFLTALRSGRYELLGEAMEDRLHQSYRARLVPGLEEVLRAARLAGAWGASLSGAGPSVIALCPPAEALRVGEAMTKAFQKHDVSSLFLPLRLGGKGAHVAEMTTKTSGRSK
jgi:homoserine kinase